MVFAYRSKISVPELRFWFPKNRCKCTLISQKEKSILTFIFKHLKSYKNKLLIDAFKQLNERQSLQNQAGYIWNKKGEEF